MMFAQSTTDRRLSKDEAQQLVRGIRDIREDYAKSMELLDQRRAAGKITFEQYARACDYHMQQKLHRESLLEDTFRAPYN